jgi:hypothetical protein
VNIYRILVHDLETRTYNLILVPDWMIPFSLAVARQHNCDATLLDDWAVTPPLTEVGTLESGDLFRRALQEVKS